MFQNFTEMARRVIFYSRYEASQYGSPVIDTEHLLLGLLREHGVFVQQFLAAKTTVADFRSQIESHITTHERISTSVEVPLTGDSKKVLNLAVEQAGNLRNRQVGADHILLGILGVPTSLAARLLLERGADANAIRQQIAKTPAPANEKERTAQYRKNWDSQKLEEATSMLESFVQRMKSPGRGELADFFAQNARLIDSSGKCWTGSEEIQKQTELLFAPYATKNVSARVERCELGPADTVLGNVLWENVAVVGQPQKSLHRMTFVIASENDEWTIYLLQVTPVTI